ncbi:DNA-directed RNA polymerase [Truncatella angustata]|uniref:DNA-directed RNA polymerase n=1 Tax=Truncatella angustata TaxID=152316 RepID=A0A9P8UXS1_9PEZI|nr:DNA-directed RNA polymerase [Truncatella angustata]KAH6659879.1 DNA-directed RNA polymerase [Truncatella angustata]
MFVRPSSQRSLSLSKVNTLHRPQLLSRCLTARPGSLVSSHRLLVTRPDLLPWQRSSGRVSRATHHERSLATAIDDARSQKELDLPYGLPMYGQRSPPPPRTLASYEFRHFDPAKPLIVRNDFEEPAKLRTSAQGVPGDLESMLSVFEACLHVQHLDRAALVLKRLDDTELMPGPELVNLHNRYLAANIERFYSHPDNKWAESMQSWYETRIRALGLPQTPETIAYMLKISLISGQDQDKLERRINRYMGMVPGDAGLQVYSYSDILSDQDLAKITSLCTTHNYSPEDFIIEGGEVSQSELPNEFAAQQDPTKSGQTVNPEAEVMAVPQKGLGLKTLREVLSFFTDIQGSDISKLPLNEQREIQARLERDCVEAAISRWREEHQALMKMGRNTSLSTNALNSQLYDWQCALEKRIEEDIAVLAKAETQQTKSSEDIDRILIAPFLRQSTPARLAAVTILSTLNQTAQAPTDNGATIATAVSNLAKALEEDVRLFQNHEARKAKKAQRRVLRRQAAESEQSTMPPSIATPTNKSPASNVVEPTSYDGQAWPVAIKTKLGAFLTLALIDTAKITVSREHPSTKQLVSQVQPAFSRSSIFKKGKRVGMVCPNKHLTELMKREPRGDFLARHLPMLVQPDSWTKFDKGGFLEFPSTIIRVKNGEKDQKVYTEAAIQRGDLDQVCKGLDVLGRTGWKVNRPVFQVMLDAWNTGEGIANFPPLNPDMPLPPEPEASEDPMIRKTWISQVKLIENEKSGLHSERCFINFQMEIANAFKDQTFYFPHNMDFRGRAYPIPTYLNHMGADNARGLLQFAKGRELGVSGLNWLKVHLANVFGFDKASISEREEFALNNMDNIIESATNPLNGNKWWLKAEDPWQCLAACFELKAAMSLPDPTKYVSHLPVHQDGTCNGLQHYAALGGDLWGAQQVNLEPGERPADVYSAVADLVKESIVKDVETGNPLAKIMNGKITRKVVKQTVMTNVYGVTFIGARAQVQKQIEAAYPKIKDQTGIPPVLLASYVASKIFKALSTMFSGAHDIQYWLAECAGRVCRALTPEQLDKMAEDSEALMATEAGGASASPREAKSASMKKASLKNKKSKIGHGDLLSQWRSTIVWTTPLRLPVVQPYRKGNTRTITTALQDLNLVIPERSDPVNRRKQLQAFPPNFIHSLDATHMLLSALESDEKGLTFAAVHDSFWTHAADVDVMNGVLRDSFIRIHSEDVVQRLAAEFEARYKGSLYLAKIESGSQVERDIVEFRKGARLQLHDEVLLERERQRLLQSTDPDEVSRGRSMRTPASIFEEHNAQQVSDAAIEFGDVGFGQVPPPEEVVKSALEEVADADVTSPKSPWAKTINFNVEDPRKLKNYLEVNGFEAEITKTEPKKTHKASSVAGVWLPIAFPDVPKKGDFDVKRLRGSQYFFS